MAESLEELAALWEKGVISGDEYVVRKYQASRAPVVSQVVTVSGVGAAGLGMLKYGKLAMAAVFTSAAALGIYGAMHAGTGSGSAASEPERHERHELTGNSGPHIDGMPRVIISDHALAVTHTGHRTRSSTQSDDCAAAGSGDAAAGQHCDEAP